MAPPSTLSDEDIVKRVLGDEGHRLGRGVVLSGFEPHGRLDKLGLRVNNPE